MRLTFTCRIIRSRVCTCNALVVAQSVRKETDPHASLFPLQKDTKALLETYIFFSKNQSNSYVASYKFQRQERHLKETNLKHTLSVFKLKNIY